MTAQARVRAPAKVNLRLRVLAKRPDGYHELDTLFQAIDLTDDVRVSLVGDGLRLGMEGPDLGAAAHNLAYRAAERLAARVGYHDGIEVELTKRIPAGAGLGGGSSDAAAVLRCLGRLLDVGDGDARVRAVAEELGSDVPFFLCGSALARAGGRGELLEPLPALPSANLVLVTPPVHVSTAKAYAALSEARGASAAVPPTPVAPPHSWEEAAAGACNDFQAVIAGAHPEIARSLGALEEAGASFVLMSGSGSSAFGFFSARPTAERAAGALSEQLGWPCRVVRTLDAMPEVRLD